MENGSDKKNNPKKSIDFQDNQTKPLKNSMFWKNQLGIITIINLFIIAVSFITIAFSLHKIERLASIYFNEDGLLPQNGVDPEDSKEKKFTTHIFDELSISIYKDNQEDKLGFTSRQIEAFTSSFAQESGILAARKIWNIDEKETNITVITFDTDQYQLDNSKINILENFCNQIGDQKSSKIKIIGYTDRVGGINYNLRLAAKRASQVATSFMAVCDTYEGELIVMAAGENYFYQPEKTQDDIPSKRNRSVELRLF